MEKILELALSKLVKSDFVPQVGEHYVNQTVTLHVEGTVTKGEDYERDATTEIPYLKAFYLFADRIRGVVQENQLNNVFDILVESITDSIKNPDEKVENICKNIADIKRAEKMAKEKIIDRLPKQKVKGQVRVRGKVNLVEMKEVK